MCAAQAQQRSESYPKPSTTAPSNTDMSETSLATLEDLAATQAAELKIRSRQASLANLRPWRKGQSGNRKGRPAAGLTVIEWYNAMQGKTKDKLEAISKDDKQPVTKRLAADQWLQTISKAMTTAGVPIRGEAIDRICDRTAGKPTQHQEISGPGGGAIEIEQRVTDLASCLKAFETYQSSKPNV
jgi:hypothetical protein